MTRRKPVCSGIGLLLLSIASTGLAEAQQAGALRCEYERRFVCTAEACEPSSVAAGYLELPGLDVLQRAGAERTPLRILRCDGRDCVPLEIDRTTSEGFVTLTGRGGAFLLKIFARPDAPQLGLRTGDFTEVVTSMMMTWVGYGRCSRPPGNDGSTTSGANSSAID